MGGAGSHNGDLGGRKLRVTQKTSLGKRRGGGGKSQRLWFLQKTNLLGEVPILAVSLSFHEKQWCHESAAASEQKKGSKFSCSSSSVVSKPKQSKQASKYCALCVCVFGLCGLLYNSIYKFHTLVYTCSSFLCIVFTHCYAFENGWTHFTHSSNLLGTTHKKTQKKVSLCVKWFH